MFPKGSGNVKGDILKFTHSIHAGSRALPSKNEFFQHEWLEALYIYIPEESGFNEWNALIWTFDLREYTLLPSFYNSGLVPARFYFYGGWLIYLTMFLLKLADYSN